MSLADVQFNAYLLRKDAYAAGASNVTLDASGRRLRYDDALEGDCCHFDFDSVEVFGGSAGPAPPPALLPPPSGGAAGLFSQDPAAVRAADSIAAAALAGRRRGGGAAGTEREVVVVHGAHKGAAAAVFHATVAALVERLRAELLADARAQAAWRTEASYSLARAYSWGVTDVLAGSAATAAAALTPVRLSAAADARLSGSAAPASGAAAAAAAPPPLAHLIDLQSAGERAALADVLRDSCLVPQGHSAVCLELSLRRYALSGGGAAAPAETRAWCVCLLPSLARVNRLFRKELVALSHVLRGAAAGGHWEEQLRESALAGFLFGQPDGAGRRPATCVRVATVVEDAFAAGEEGKMHCWYGCRASSLGGVLPAWREAGLLTPGWARGDGKENAELREAGGVETPTRRALLEGTPSPSPPPRGSLALMAAAREDARAEAEALRRERDALRAEVAELGAEVVALAGARDVLEGELGALVQLLRDAAAELETQESCTLSEVRRAERMLALAETAATSQEQAMLERLVTLASRRGGAGSDGAPLSSVTTPRPSGRPTA